MLHSLHEAPSISNDTETILFINVVRLQYMFYDTMYHFDKKEKKSRKLQLLYPKSFISGKNRTSLQVALARGKRKALLFAKPLPPGFH